MEAILVTDKHSNFPVWFLPPVIGSWWPPAFYSFFFFSHHTELPSSSASHFHSSSWRSTCLAHLGWYLTPLSVIFYLGILKITLVVSSFFFFLWTAREWECLRRTAWRWRVLLFQTFKFSRHLSGHFVAKVKNAILFLLSKSIPRMKCAVKIGCFFCLICGKWC